MESTNKNPLVPVSEKEVEFLVSYNKDTSSLIDSEFRQQAEQKGWKIDEDQSGNVTVIGYKTESRIKEKEVDVIYSEKQVDSILNSALKESLYSRFKASLGLIFKKIIKVIKLNYIVAYDWNIETRRDFFTGKCTLRLSIKYKYLFDQRLRIGDSFRIKLKSGKYMTFDVVSKGHIPNSHYYAHVDFYGREWDYIQLISKGKVKLYKSEGALGCG